MGLAGAGAEEEEDEDAEAYYNEVNEDAAYDEAEAAALARMPSGGSGRDGGYYSADAYGGAGGALASASNLTGGCADHSYDLGDADDDHVLVWVGGSGERASKQAPQRARARERRPTASPHTRLEWTINWRLVW